MPINVRHGYMPLSILMESCQAKSKEYTTIMNIIYNIREITSCRLYEVELLGMCYHNINRVMLKYRLQTLACQPLASSCKV